MGSLPMTKQLGVCWELVQMRPQTTVSKDAGTCTSWLFGFDALKKQVEVVPALFCLMESKPEEPPKDALAEESPEQEAAPSPMVEAAKQEEVAKDEHAKTEEVP